MKLELQPIKREDAFALIRAHHRHHDPPVSWKFGTSVTTGDRVVGVIVVGRPVSRMLDNGLTLEATRCCTDSTPHVASMLYAAARRAAKALGYRRLITYTLASEPGTSLRAAGFARVYETLGGSWDRPSRRRTDRHPTEPKALWEMML